MKKNNNIKKVSYVCFVFVALLLTSCADIEQSHKKKSPEAFSTIIEASIYIGDMYSRLMRATPDEKANWQNVTRVTVTATYEDTNVEKFSTDAIRNPLTGIWEITVVNMETNTDFIFIVNAYEGETQTFTGMTTRTFSNEGDNSLNIIVNQSNEFSVTFPKILRISRPSTMLTGDTQPINVTTEGQSGELLAYEFLKDENALGTFAPSDGSLQLPSGIATGTFSTDYTSELELGNNKFSVKVQNSAGNAAETVFNINVNGVDVPIGVVPAPVVHGVKMKRDGTQIIFTAYAGGENGTDDNLTYVYGFSGTAGVSFISPNQNNAVLEGYNDTISGTVTLTVTSISGIQTTVTFGLLTGQFPDTAIEDIVQ